jgi:hypothetical protein
MARRKIIVKEGWIEEAREGGNGKWKDESNRKQTCLYIISIPVRFTNTHSTKTDLFLMELTGTFHAFPQHDIRNRKDNVPGRLKKPNSLYLSSDFTKW